MASSLPTLNKAFDDALALLDSLYAQSASGKPLWPAPYNELTIDSAYKWLTECWWTFNEANGLIELVPAEEFVYQSCVEWVTAFKQKRPAVFEKSRRLVFSWIARGLETWVCGLSRADWMIVDQTDASAGEHLWRVHFSLEQLYERRPELGLKPHEARGAVLTKNVSDVVLSNGSWLSQSHQEAASKQGKGKTGITLEELSKYMAPSAFFDQAVIITQGDPSQIQEGQFRSGGWVCAIANAAINPDWQAIKGDGFDEEGKPQHVKATDLLKDPEYRLMEGMAARTLDSGTRYVAIHYTADSNKRGDWRNRASQSVTGGLTGRTWRREYELMEEGYEGKPVYETYDDDLHCPEVFRSNRIPLVKGSIYVCGWDAGVSMTPAACLLQITQYPNTVQVHCLLEVTSTGNEPMSLFAPRVMKAIEERIGSGLRPSVRHVGDGTIKNRMGNTGKSAAQIAKEKVGINIIPMSNIENVRQSAVTNLLTAQIRVGNSSGPMFVLDGCCTMIREGFNGAYRFEKMKTSDGSVRWKPHPEKNAWSDPHDALQYGCLGAEKYLKKLT